MINKPTNWNEISENSVRKLTPGGYVAVIKKVIDFPNDSYFEVQYDIAEGEFKGVGLEAMEQWGNWNLTFRVYYTDKAMWSFKKFISRVEQTNNGFQFDWNNINCLVNRGIGIVVGERQYYGKDGTIKSAPSVQDYATAADIREGKMPSQPRTIPPKAVANAAAPAPAVGTNEPIDFSDGDLPF